MDEKNTSIRTVLPLPLLRVVSLILTLTILVGDPSFAASVSDFVRPTFSHDLRDLSVPGRFGTVTDKWIAPGSGFRAQGSDNIAVGAHSPQPQAFVVLIQDLHANIGVQKNIAGVVEYLYHRYRISSIFSEAAFGRLEPAALRTLSSRRAQAKLIDKLLSQALLTGEELAAARTGRGGLSPLKLQGIDDPLLYFANVQAFRDLVRVGVPAAGEWKSLRELLMPGASPQLRQHLELTEKLLSLKLLDNEWLNYKEHRNLTPRGSPDFNEAIAAGERFYTAAEARNGAFVENLLSQLDRTAVLVTGGFHTATVAHALKSRGIGFAVVTPKVDRLDQEELYRQSMTEPPHETVRAIAATITDIQGLKTLLSKRLHLTDLTRWMVSRPKTYAHERRTIGGPSVSPRDWFSWLTHLLSQFLWPPAWRQNLEAYAYQRYAAPKELYLQVEERFEDVLKMRFSDRSLMLEPLKRLEQFYREKWNEAGQPKLDEWEFLEAQIQLLLERIQLTDLDLDARHLTRVDYLTAPDPNAGGFRFYQLFAVQPAFTSQSPHLANLEAPRALTLAIRLLSGTYRPRWALAFPSLRRATVWAYSLVAIGVLWAGSFGMLKAFAPGSSPAPATPTPRAHESIVSSTKHVSPDPLADLHRRIADQLRHVPVMTSQDERDFTLHQMRLEVGTQDPMLQQQLLRISVKDMHQDLDRDAEERWEARVLDRQARGIVTEAAPSVPSMQQPAQAPALAPAPAALPHPSGSQRPDSRLPLQIFASILGFFSFTSLAGLFGQRRRERSPKAIFNRTQDQFNEAWRQLTNSGNIYADADSARRALQKLEANIQAGELASAYRNREAFGSLYARIRTAKIEPLGGGYQIKESAQTISDGQMTSNVSPRSPPKITLAWIIARAQEVFIAVSLLAAGILLLATTPLYSATLQWHPHLATYGWILIAGGFAVLIPALKRAGYFGRHRSPSTVTGVAAIALGMFFGVVQWTPTRQPIPQAVVNEQEQATATPPPQPSAVTPEPARLPRPPAPLEVDPAMRELDEKVRNELTALAEIQKKIESNLDPSKAVSLRVPVAELEKAFEALQNVHADRLASDFAAIRKNIPAGVTALDEALKPLENFTTQVDRVEQALKSLQTRISSGQASLSAEEIRQILLDVGNLLQTTGTPDELIQHLRDLANMAQPLGLANAPPTDIQEIRTLYEAGAIDDAIDAVNDFVNNWKDLENWQTQRTNLESEQRRLEKEIATDERRITDSNATRYYPLSHENRQWMAELIQSAASSSPLSQLAQEARFRLEALKDQQGAWGDALRISVQALTALSEAHDQLLDDSLSTAQQWAALRRALLALGEMQAHLRVFDRTLNAQYALDEGIALPISPDTLASQQARASFETFKAGTQGLSDQQVMARWYGAFLDDLTKGFSLEQVQRLIPIVLAMGEDELNQWTQMQNYDDASDEKKRSAATAGQAAKDLEGELTRLKELEAKIQKQSEAAQKIAPDVSLVNVLTPSPEDLHAYAMAVQKLQSANLHYKSDKDHPNPNQFLGELWKELSAHLNNDQPLSLEESTRLADLLFLAFDQFPNLINPDLIDLSAQKKDKLIALHEFMQATARFSLRYLGGLANERIRQGVTDRDSYVSQWLQLMAGALSPEVAAKTEKFVKQLERDGGIGRGMGLDAHKPFASAKKLAVESWWDILQAMNLVYSIKFAVPNWDSMTLHVPFKFYEGVITFPSGNTGSSLSFPGIFQILAPGSYTVKLTGREFVYVNPSDQVSVALGAADGFVNAVGTIKESAIALTGSQPHAAVAFYASVLDPKLFGHASWKVYDKMDQPPQEKYIYFPLPDGRVMRTESAVDFKADPNRWRQNDDLVLPQGHFYTWVGGHRYIWVAGKDKVNVLRRLDALRKAGVSALLSWQIAQGLITHDDFRTRLVRLDHDYLSQFLAGVRFWGGIQQAAKLLDVVMFKRAINATDGAWIYVPKPKFVIKVTDDTKQPSVVMRIDKEGTLLYERTGDNGKKAWDDQNGTVQFMEGGGPWRRLFDVATGRFGGSVRMYQPSRVSAQDAKKSLIDGHTRYVRRRPDSAPVMAGADKTYVSTTLQGEPVHWKLGALTHEIPLHGRQVRGYAFYTMDAEGKAHDWLGIIETDKDGNFQLDNRGRIRPGTIHFAIGSEVQKFKAFRNLVKEGEWADIDPVLAATILAELPVQGDTGWLVDISGVDQYRDSSGRIIFTRWQEDSGFYFLDMRDPTAEKLYQLTQTPDGQWHLAKQAATSLQALAGTKELAHLMGRWGPSPQGMGKPERGATIWNIPGNQAQVWLDRNGTWRLVVPQGTSLILGGRTLTPGFYQFTIGEAGASQAQNAIEGPEDRIQPVPAPIDLESPSLFNPATDRKEERINPDGSQETIYSFQKRGTFIRHADGSVDYVSPSRQRLEREQAELASDQPTYYQRLYAFPKAMSSYTWVPGDGGEYAYDVGTGEYLRRVRSADGRSWLTYHGVATAAGARRLATLKRSAGNSFWYPLPPNIPAEVMKQVPAYQKDPMRFHQTAGGQWEYLETSVLGTRGYLEQLRQGGASILDPVVTLDQLRARFSRERKALIAHTLAGRQAVTYGGVEFDSYMVPITAKDLKIPALTVLQARTGGAFTDPESGKTTQLVAGQIILPSTSLRQIQEAKQHMDSPIPRLVPTFQSAESMLAEARLDGRTVETGPTNGRLPALFGLGADQITGRWYRAEIKIGGIKTPQLYYFQVNDQGGDYTDKVTGRQVHLDPNALLVVGDTPLTADAFKRFHEGPESTFTLSLLDEVTLRVMGDMAAPDRSQAPVRLPGTTVEGYFLEPNHPNSPAPTAFVVTWGGQISDLLRTRKDSIVPEMVPVNPGDVLVLQLPSKILQLLHENVPGPASTLMDVERVQLEGTPDQPVIRVEATDQITVIDVRGRTSKVYARDARRPGEQGEMLIESSWTADKRERTDVHWADRARGVRTLVDKFFFNELGYPIRVITAHAQNERYLSHPEADPDSEYTEIIYAGSEEFGRTVSLKAFPSQGGRIIRRYRNDVPGSRSLRVEDRQKRENYREMLDARGRDVLEIRADFELHISYVGGTYRRRVAQLLYRGHPEPIRDYRYGDPLPFSESGINLQPSELQHLRALLGLTGNTLVLPVQVQTIWGERYTEYSILGNPSGTTFVRLYTDGTKRIVDRFTDETNIPVRWHLLTADNRPGFHAFTPSFSGLADWVREAYLALLKLESDPRLYEPGVAAAIYPLDGSEPQYINEQQLNQIGSRIMTIVQLANGNWVPAIWNPVALKWHPVAKIGEPSLWGPVGTPFQLSIPYTEEDAPHGLVTRDGQVSAIVDFPEKHKPKTITSVSQAEAEEFLKTHSIAEFQQAYTASLPHPERLRKVRLGPNGAPMITINIDTGLSRVVFDNAVTGKLTVDTFRGENLVSREYYGNGNVREDELTYALYYGPEGEKRPLYRAVGPRKGVPQRRIDEVYEVPDPTAQPLRILRIRLIRDAQLQYDATLPPETLYPTYLAQAQAKLTRQEGAFQVEEFYDVRTGLIDGLPTEDRFKIRESFTDIGGNFRWHTIYNYDPKTEMLVGSDIQILVSDGLNGWIDLHAGYHVDISEPVLLKNLRRHDGSRVLSDQAYLNAGYSNPDQTYIIRSHVMTSWGTEYDEYRRVGEARLLLFEQGTDRRLNVKFEGDDASESLQLDPHDTVMGQSFYDRDERADKIFTAERVAQIARRTGETPRQFWDHLHSLGIQPDTRLPVIRIVPKIMHGSISKGITYSEDHPSAELYLLPVDPPRGREIARLTATGDFTVNSWWKEPGASRTAQVPFGILPENVALLHDGSYRRAIYEKRDQMAVNTNLRDFNGRLFGSDQIVRQLEELGLALIRSGDIRGSRVVHGLLDPVTRATNFADIKSAIARGTQQLNTLGDQPAIAGLAAIIRDTSLVYNLEGMPVSIYRIESTRSKERQLTVMFSLDGRLVAEDYFHEALQVLKGYLGTPSAQLGIERLYYDIGQPYQRPIASVLRGVPSRPGRPDAQTGLLIREFDGMEFHDTDGTQAIEVYSQDREGMDLNKVYPHTSRFRNGEMIDMERNDLPGSWIKDPKLWALVRDSFIVWLLLAGVGLIIRRIKSRSINSALPPLPQSRINAIRAQELSQAIQQIDSIQSLLNFPTSALELAKDQLKKQLTDRMEKGDSLDSIVERHFDTHRLWRSVILQQPVTATEHFDLRDMLISLTLTQSSGNFNTPVPAFLHYLFHKIRFDHKDGRWVQQEVDKWHGILMQNQKIRWNKPKPPLMSEILTYDDMEGNFRSRSFITDYDANPNLVPAVKSPRFKTYIEKAGGPFGVKGWLRAWYNHWQISSLYLAGLIVGLKQGGVFTDWSTWAYYSAGLAVGLTALWVVLNAWFRPQNPYAKDSAGPDRGIRKLPVSLGNRLFRAVFWLGIAAAKLTWNYWGFYWLRQGTWTLMDAHWAFTGGNYILMGLMYLVFVIFYFIDTFAFFYAAQTIAGNLIGHKLGLSRYAAVTRERRWQKFASEFDVAREQFMEKLLTPAVRNMPPNARHVAWARVWNRILYKLYEEDRLSLQELKDLRYDLADEPSGEDPDHIWPPDFLNTTIRRGPHSLQCPVNAEAADRLISFGQSLFMEMERMPAWTDMASLTVMTPLLEEDVIYTLDNAGSNEDLNMVENTGWTRLTYLISRYEGEWNNFVDRMERRYGNTPDIQAMRHLQLGQKLNVQDPDLRMEVRLWATFRFQALGRTVRGAMRNQEAVMTLARMNFPTATRHQINAMAKEKFQYVVGAQKYGHPDMLKPAHAPKKDALEWLMRHYPDLEVTYLGEENGQHFSALIQYNALTGRIEEKTRINLPGDPIMGQGKPENQANIMRYVRHEKVQPIDMNQDGYFEQVIKKWNVMERFRRNSRLVMIGIRERIVTAAYGLIAWYNAFADGTFSSAVLRVLVWLGVHQDYGHPNIWDFEWIKKRSGVSLKPYLNEDIFAGYMTHLQGGDIERREEMEEGKAREVSVGLVSKLFGKFGMGAAQQVISRQIYWWHRSPMISLTRRLSHFFGANGFYVREPLVQFGIFSYNAVLLLLGISAFNSIPSEAWGGYQLILLSQAISGTGLGQMALGVGWAVALGIFIQKWMQGMLPFFQAMVLTQGSGMQGGLKGKEAYPATGRGFDLDYKKPSELFEIFKGSHIYFSLINLVLAGFGILLWQSYSVLWSWPFIVATLSGLLVPFIMNRGGTPMDIGVATWEKLTFQNFNLLKGYLESKADAKIKKRAAFLLIINLAAIIFTAHASIIANLVPIITGALILLTLWDKFPSRWIQERRNVGTLPVALGVPFGATLFLLFHMTFLNSLLLTTPYVLFVTWFLSEDEELIPLLVALTGSFVYTAALAPSGIRWKPHPRILGMPTGWKAYRPALFWGLIGSFVLLSPIWYFGTFSLYVSGVIGFVGLQFIVNRLWPPGPVPVINGQGPSLRGLLRRRALLTPSSKAGAGPEPETPLQRLQELADHIESATPERLRDYTSTFEAAIADEGVLEKMKEQEDFELIRNKVHQKLENMWLAELASLEARVELAEPAALPGLEAEVRNLEEAFRAYPIIGASEIHQERLHSIREKLDSRHPTAAPRRLMSSA